MPGQIRMPEAENNEERQTLHYCSHTARLSLQVMDKSGIAAALPRQTPALPIKGTCIQGAENYAAWSENVKEFIAICDTNVPPRRTLACSPHAAAGSDPKSWSDFGKNLRRFGTPPSSSNGVN